jgi:uncharacterized protein
MLFSGAFMEDLFYAFNPWWEKKEFKTGILRSEYLKALALLQKRRQIELITGSRRVGKTTILRQLVRKMLDEGAEPTAILYLALDHPRLSPLPLSELLTMFRKLFLHDRDKKLTLFLDEIQESQNWEAELKSIYDLEEVKIICTGSTSHLIKSHGGKLTGRHITTTIYPLSFSEYLIFAGQAVGRAEPYKYEKYCEEYLLRGGYPEYILNPDEIYLASLLDDIIARDIAGFFRIQKTGVFKDLFRLVASSVGARSSYNKISRILGVSLDTIKDYLSHFEAAYLTGAVEKWSPSHADRIYSQKKYYLLDTGLKTLMTGRGDLGARAENVTFIHLVKNSQSPGYWAESGREVDFIVGSHGTPMPIEVKFSPELDISAAFKGIRLFFRRFPETRKALLITMRDERTITVDDRPLLCVPLWKFLLGDPRPLLEEMP